jgi:hypothetical protein
VTYADLEKMPRRRRPYHASRATAAIHGQRGVRHRLMWIWQGSGVRTRKIAPAEARASSIAAFAALAERLDALANRPPAVAAEAGRLVQMALERAPSPGP